MIGYATRKEAESSRQSQENILSFNCKSCGAEIYYSAPEDTYNHWVECPWCRKISFIRYPDDALWPDKQINIHNLTQAACEQSNWHFGTAIRILMESANLAYRDAERHISKAFRGQAQTVDEDIDPEINPMS